MSMMIHRAVMRQRELERKMAEKPVEAKAPTKKQGDEIPPAPKRGRKTKGR